MNFDEKKQLLIVAVFCGFLFVGELTIGWTLKSENDEIAGRLSALEARKASAQAKIRTIPMMQDKAESLSSIVRDYTAILPEKDEVRRDAFVDTITGLCRDSGLTIVKAEPVKVLEKARVVSRRDARNAVPQAKEAFTRHKYRFEMTGEFSQLHRFINSVENHPRFLRVDGIELFPSGDSTGLEAASSPDKRLSVMISTYVYEDTKKSLEAIQ